MKIAILFNAYHAQRWPVRKPVPEKMYKSRVTKREYPYEPLTTTTRIIDTFFPIARGGTACIPGPFGAGKTVLQNLISRYTHIDIVIIVACGERAGEVVETITEFPNTPDPLISWSRYLDQLKPWFDKNINVDWVSEVKMMHEMLHRGEAIYQMMQVTGEEGITIEDYIDWQKSTLVDMVFLQQDAFDVVDVTVSSERQQESFALMKRLITQDYTFKDKDESREFFTKITGLYRNFNYSPIDAPAYKNYKREIKALSDKYLGI